MCTSSVRSLACRLRPFLLKESLEHSYYSSKSGQRSALVVLHPLTGQGTTRKTHPRNSSAAKGRQLHKLLLIQLPAVVPEPV